MLGISWRSVYLAACLAAVASGVSKYNVDDRPHHLVMGSSSLVDGENTMVGREHEGSNNVQLPRLEDRHSARSKLQQQHSHHGFEYDIDDDDAADEDFGIDDSSFLFEQDVVPDNGGAVGSGALSGRNKGALFAHVNDQRFSKFVSSVDPDHVIEGHILHEVKQIVLYAGYYDPRGIVDPRRVDELLQRAGDAAKEQIIGDMVPIVTRWDHLEGIKLRGKHAHFPEPSVANLFVAQDGVDVVRRGLEVSLLETGRDHPVAWTVWSQLGNTWRAHGDVYKAIQCFRRALVLSPDNPDVLLNLAVVLGNMGYHANARQLIEVSVSKKPDGVLHRFVYGSILQRQGFMREAIESFRRCLALDPKFSLAGDRLRALSADPRYHHDFPGFDDLYNESAGGQFPLTLHSVSLAALVVSTVLAVIVHQRVYSSSSQQSSFSIDSNIMDRRRKAATSMRRRPKHRYRSR